MLFPRLILPLLLLTATMVRAEDYDKLPVQKDRAFYQLKGPVNQVTEVKWVPSKDSAVFSTRTEIFVDDKTYTRERSEQRTFGQEGNILNEVSEERSGKRKNKTLTQSRKFYYKNEKLIAIANGEDGEPVDSVEFHYRRKGPMDYYRVFDPKGKEKARIEFTYKNGKLFSIRKKNDEHFPVSTVKYKYKGDRLSETRHFDGNSLRVETRRYSYKTGADGNLNDSYSVLDEKGNLKEGLLLIKDSTGKLLERNVISGEREVMEYNGFQYNSHQDAETEKVFGRSIELTITNRYTYDEYDNWTRKEVFYNGILNAVILRSISYYGKE